LAEGFVSDSALTPYFIRIWDFLDDK